MNFSIHFIFQQLISDQSGLFPIIFMKLRVLKYVYLTMCGAELSPRWTDMRPSDLLLIMITMDNVSVPVLQQCEMLLLYPSEMIPVMFGEICQRHIPASYRYSWPYRHFCFIEIFVIHMMWYVFERQQQQRIWWGSSGAVRHSETIVTRSKAVTGNDIWCSDCVAPSQSSIELTLDNEPLFKYQSFY